MTAWGWDDAPEIGLECSNCGKPWTDDHDCLRWYNRAMTVMAVCIGACILAIYLLLVFG